MNGEKCTNQNHSKMNVLVRFCSECGKVVNKNIRKLSCSNEEHIEDRKSGRNYCVDCGTNLKTTS